MDEERAKCKECGTRQEDWEADRFAYVSEYRVCPGCEMLEYEHAENVPEGQRGVKVYLLPREVAEERMEAGEARTDEVT